MSSPFDDIFTITTRTPPKPQPRRYLATFPCGSTGEYDRDDLEVPDFTDGEQNGTTFCFATLAEARAALAERGCTIELIKPD